MIGRRVTMILLVGLLFYACSQEEHDVSNQSESTNVDLRLTRLSDNMRVRIIATDTSNGKVAFNEHITPQNGKYNLELKVGIYNFHVLMNEPTRLTPSLNGITNQSELSAATVLFTELPNDPSESTEESELPAMKTLNLQVRVIDKDLKTGEVSIDNGQTWISSLNLDTQVERLAAKLSLNLRKNTPQAGDIVIIKKVTISKVPTYSYLLSERPYTGTNFESLTPYNSSTGITFSQNVTDTNRDDNYTTIFEDLILPEYILSDRTDESSAVLIEIEVDYNGETRRYYIRPKNDPVANDYRLVRNTHYMINGTIVTSGELEFEPNAGYIVADWEDKNIGTSFVENTAITFSSKWADGTDITPAERLIRITGNQSAEFHFILSNPENATWTATLTNPYDFAFDYTDGAVSTGRTSPGNYYKIKIKPRDPNVTSRKETSFYITVFNSPENVELDLTEQGKENKYVIRQTPY